MSYPNMETYRKLYARYIAENGRPVSDLMDLAGDLTGKNVADLCGGAGEIAFEAVKRGAMQVEMVDAEINMSDRYGLIKEDIDFYEGDVRSWTQLGNVALPTKFDVVFCRQAINYWLYPFYPTTDHVVENLKSRMNEGGQFIFNTFNQCPGGHPTTKEYEFNGLKYVEVSWMLETGLVQHVQCCEGMEPHTTSFWWISPEKFRAFLEPFFKVEVFSEGKTDIYRCTS